ncbi:PROTEIN DISULFIDE ISOMERASE 12, PDI-like 5-3, ARABIDOPSIS THALIANA PROTEIN DISULFIDE ISOMERASE 12 [Hibiscus trionum]|uniref:PROTEIN DISULFIDE ISOMERASE 12, PDI-like 5-3, ARABIDOPSIS THALIANA PROTEIN DISULFIDE ISOMERASE 12 n=1 Tax=Hibiscus trionum TaxID=183268 RepID=A0A9W7LSY4_HIBTR|nr:PROTEIN DISULFIDE ISOMERASE 12, PDI-like 5-3, ARABIDOPSIS THALIANA PROTEIN DISULFIDE ISOMERASE 12 [Hibiscus trionum]
MVSLRKIKSVDFYRKIPRDLTEASVLGAWLSIVAAVSMILLFGMELNNYLTVSTSTSIIVDNSSDGDFLRIDFNISFPALSCEFASVDVSDVLGTNRLNITKTLRKFTINPDLRRMGAEYNSEPVPQVIQHGEEVDDEAVPTLPGSVSLNSDSFDRIAHEYPILVVNFFAPWCYWSTRLRPSWEKTAKILRERHNPETDGRIILGKVDCTEDIELCKRHHIQGYPSIRIFRKGSDLREDHGLHEHESYYGDRDTEALVKAMEELVSPVPLGNQKLALAPLTGGCRIEGYVRVKKIPGNLIISARSDAHSFDSSQINMSHVVSHLSFGKTISPRVLSDVKRLIPYIGRSHDKLNGRSFISHRDLDANVTIEHYLQVVKTEVVTRIYSRESSLLEDYEYTAHSSLSQSVDVPVAKFHFELSPMQVLIIENSKSFSHFITNLCAIIGGVFTVAGILDSIFYNTIRLMRKIDLGKNF